MEGLVRAALDLRHFKFSLDDDLVDRLNRQYTSGILILFAVLVSARQFFGESLHCWCPEVCAGNHERYANLFCWVDNTYYVPFDEKMPQRDEGRDRKITYYQWVPIILMLQAGMFTAPYALWRVLSSRSGIDLAAIVGAANSSQESSNPDQRKNMLRYAVHLMDRYLMARRDNRTGCLSRARQLLSRSCICVSGRMYGNYMTCSYIVVKILYCINSVGQLFLLNIFLGYEFHLFGVQVIRHLLLGDKWTPSERFPHVSMCDFRIRQNTNVHRYTYQCVLPINIFNEKIFIIVWFWLLIVGVMTVIGLVGWVFQLTYWPAQYRYVQKQLGGAMALDSVSSVAVSAIGLAPNDVASKTDMRKFADAYLRRDGLFVLRLVAKNAGDLVSTELLAELWKAYSLSHRHVLPANNGSFKAIRSLLKGSNRRASAPPPSNVVHHNDRLSSPRIEEDV